MTKDNKIFWLSRLRFKILVGIVIIIAAGVSILKFLPSKGEGLAKNVPTFTVRQGPMRISVTESGTISAREQVIIKSQVEGVTTILSLVPEGTLVKKGDLLIELDASKLLDKKIDQEIKVQNAEAAFISSRENLAVTENQVQSDIDKAELTLKLANLDFEKYTDPNGGEYSNQLMDAHVRITLSEGELKRAESRLQWSEKLAREKYISEIELERDRLDAKKADLDLKLAQGDLKLLEKFTYNRKLEELRSDVKQSEMAIDRSKRKAKADIVQAKAELRAKGSEYKRQQDKLKKIEEQIEKTKIYAPSDGLVIYATSVQGGRRGNSEPLSEGQEVRQRQELIYLPTALSMKAKVKIHEASIKKVSLGLPAKIEVDALPGRTFTGNVVKIAPLPDAQMAWLNPDLKVYNAEININEEDSNLRTGMSCKAEIVIDEYKNVIYVPIQAVIRINTEPSVYVKRGNNFQPREVELGLDNSRMIRIIKGLKPGEEVLLNPPLAAGTIGISADKVPKEKASQGTGE